MTAYIAWLGLPSVLVAAWWCWTVAQELRWQEARCDERSLAREGQRRFALAFAQAAEWRERRGIRG